MTREHKTRVISLDPNIRPGFIKDKGSPGRSPAWPICPTS